MINRITSQAANNAGEAQGSSRQETVSQLIEALMVFGRTAGHGNDGGQLLRTHNLSLPQLPVLMYVHNAPNGHSIKEIAAHLNITSSAATQLVQTLLRRGILRKTSDPNDRRAVRITLTAAGSKEFRSFHAAMIKRMTQTFKAIPDAELAEMTVVFRKIIAYIQQ